VAKDKSKKASKEDAVDEEDVAEDGEEGAEGSAPKKKPSLKVLLIAGVGALMVLGGGGGAAYVFLMPKPDAAAGAAAKDHKEKKEKKPKGEKGKEGEAGGAVMRDGPDGVVFYTMPDVVVNMQAADGRPTFLKLKLTYELPDAHAAEALEPNMPRLQDMLQAFLRELRPEDLSGSQGSYQLRMEILRRVNLVIAPSKANAVLIEEMLIN
jgi:flagellar protein FliL